MIILAPPVQNPSADSILECLDRLAKLFWRKFVCQRTKSVKTNFFNPKFKTPVSKFQNSFKTENNKFVYFKIYIRK